jgi:broad specificity phosphatase PhoE
VSAAVDWQMPPSMPRWLSEVPTDRPVALLLRHSVRPPLDPGDAGYTLPLTADGVRLATDLGRRLGGRLQTLHASPLLRCVQTAEALRAGASRRLTITEDRLLGDPGAFVHDSGLAWPNWQARGHEGVMAHLVREDCALPGMAAPEAAARFLALHMLTVAAGVPGVHVFVTHDSLVTATAARLLREPFGGDAWPWYLEGAFFWRDGDDLHVAYRDVRRVGATGPICGLTEGDVVELARREVGAVVGLDCDARFFLAGGAFKTLLTGRPPRDLDLWTPSDQDRARLINALMRRGASRLTPRPFADAFEVAGRIVEVPLRTEPDTLEERLARFDLALSAVGAEHEPGDRWRAFVHPLARASVERRAVLLLKPLVNWKHALSTLARLRRYAGELRFSAPPEEEAEVWRVFDAQPREVQLGMVSRFDLAAVGDQGVREEATCRLR